MPPKCVRILPVNHFQLVPDIKIITRYTLFTSPKYEVRLPKFTKIDVLTGFHHHWFLSVHVCSRHQIRFSWGLINFWLETHFSTSSLNQRWPVFRSALLVIRSFYLTSFYKFSSFYRSCDRVFCHDEIAPKIDRRLHRFRSASRHETVWPGLRLKIIGDKCGWGSPWNKCQIIRVLPYFLPDQVTIKPKVNFLRYYRSNSSITLISVRSNPAYHLIFNNKRAE